MYEWWAGWRTSGCRDRVLLQEPVNIGVRHYVTRCVISRCASLSQVNSVLREQLDQLGTVNKGLTESLWKAREDAELWDTHLQREQEVRTTSGMKCCRQKGNRVHPFLYRDCAIKLPLSSHGVGIPFIASFVNSFSFPVHFTAMIFELLFPVKTFQLLRGRKILCKQSGVRAVNGLHLLIQGNPIICMCPSVSAGLLLLHLFGITIKRRVAVSSPHYLAPRF